ncbi:MAG TPA: hypothetical protein VMR76_00035 [Candidatus Saccharimonadia bacterium]|jgi:hypothetical protein|nr:hypothetical protein [Candidatus Saccharimonadia bacterium]
MKNQKVKVLLKGEGKNQHVLRGNFIADEQLQDFDVLTIEPGTVISHEEPSGRHAEHETLPVEKGCYILGKQVEWNPFTHSISGIWD